MHAVASADIAPVMLTFACPALAPTAPLRQSLLADAARRIATSRVRARVADGVGPPRRPLHPRSGADLTIYLFLDADGTEARATRRDFGQMYVINPGSMTDLLRRKAYRPTAESAACVESASRVDCVDNSETQNRESQ